MRTVLRHAALAAVLAAGVSTAAQANLIVNGSFEDGAPQPPVGSFATQGTSSTALTGWSITSGDIDWINGLWQASVGTHSVDMNGNNPGAISQSFATVIGALYRLTFDLAGNPDNFDGAKDVRVSAGDSSADYSFDTTSTTRAAMGWVGEELLFHATSALTTLTFTSLTTSNCCWGAAIDNVVVEAVPAPATLPLIAGALGAFAWSRRRSA